LLRLKELRIYKQLSQSDIANDFGISQQTISSYENGTREPDFELLSKFADYFDVSIDYLIGRTNDPNGNLEIPEVFKSDDPRIKELLERYSQLSDEGKEDFFEILGFFEEKEKKRKSTLDK